MHFQSAPPSDPSAALGYGARGGAWLRAMAGHDTGSGILALADQAVVSGGNFLTFVIVGRVCGDSGLGTFNLAMTFLVLLAGAQQALIATPYTIYCNQVHGREQRLYAGSALAHLLLLLPVAMAGMVLAAVSSALWLPQLELTGVLGVLAAMVPFLLLREFVRRLAFAHLRMDVALGIDTLTTSGQLVLILLLAWRGWLTPASAYLALGASCALAAGGYLAARWSQFEIRWRQARTTIRRDWKLGRWVFLQQLATIAHLYLCHWMLALIVDRNAAGVFTACVSVVMLINPFLQAMGNHFAPRYARAMAEQGLARVRRLFWQCSFVVALAVLLLFVVLAAFGGLAVEALYRGPAFAGLGTVVTVLALRMLIYSARLAAHHGLVVVERADLSVWATVLGLLTTLVASWLLIVSWGVMGAAVAWLIGSTVETTLHVASFLRVSGRGLPQPAPLEGSA
jgi:O-antigen/teichoic acid export membrane protein